MEPLDETTIGLVQMGDVTEDMDAKERARILRDKAGWDADEARGIWAIDETYVNILIDKTSGIQHLREIKDYIVQGFRWSTGAGPLAQEPVRGGVKVVLHDATIHEDPAHRGGPAQIMPAAKNAMFAAMISAKHIAGTAPPIGGQDNQRKHRTRDQRDNQAQGKDNRCIAERVHGYREGRDTRHRVLQLKR